MRAALSVFTLLILTAPTLAAQAIVYKGTLNGAAITAEFTDPADGPVVGRYSYLEHGVDIPLQAADAVDGKTRLTEEASCVPDLCPVDDDYTVTSWPVAATWTLDLAADGAITGTWQARGKSKALDISLEEIGRRTLPDDMEHTPMGLSDSVFALTYTNGKELSAQTDPYDFAKMDVALTQGPVEELDGSHFRYVTDPRTKFAFPRIVDLADGSDITAINIALTNAHVDINISALGCISQAYAGFGGRSDLLDIGFGTLAGFDEETVIVTHLSPTLTSWTESGSTFCGGAYPNNHFDSRNVDTSTGGRFAVARVFKDWLATHNYVDADAPIDQAAALAAPQDYGWQAGQSLIDYVIANKTAGDPSFEQDCGIDDLIASNLGVRFLPGDEVVFDLQHLPHVIFACTEDLLTVKLADIPELLAPTAVEVFPSLAH